MATFLPIAGIVAGFIDSIAGGGGLMTLPILLWVLHSGPDAVGTNKIPGTVAAFVALLVYRRAGHFILAQSLRFSLAVACGSVLGSLVTPRIPEFLFPVFLLVLSPIILFIIWNREIWVKERDPSKVTQSHVILWGFLAGVYDGMWGPGGGTFMFLGLFLGAKMPLLQALASSKLSNTLSAAFSLTSFGVRGYVHWKEGILLAVGIGVGAFFGAHCSNRYAVKIVRPALVVVTLLLVLRVVFF